MSKQKTGIFGKIVAVIVAIFLLGVAGVSTYCLINADFRKEVEQKLHIESSESSNDTASDTSSENQINELEEELKLKKEEILALQEELDANNLEITDLENQIADKDEQIAEKETELASVNAELETAKAENAENVELIASLESEKSALETDIESLTIDRNSYKTSHENLLTENTGLQNEIERLRSEIALLEPKINEVKNFYDNVLYTSITYFEDGSSFKGSTGSNIKGFMFLNGQDNSIYSGSSGYMFENFMQVETGLFASSYTNVIFIDYVNKQVQELTQFTSMSPDVCKFFKLSSGDVLILAKNKGLSYYSVQDNQFTTPTGSLIQALVGAIKQISDTKVLFSYKLASYGLFELDLETLIVNKISDSSVNFIEEINGNYVMASNTGGLIVLDSNYQTIKTISGDTYYSCIKTYDNNLLLFDTNGTIVNFYNSSDDTITSLTTLSSRCSNYHTLSNNDILLFTTSYMYYFDISETTIIQYNGSVNAKNVFVYEISDKIYLSDMSNKGFKVIYYPEKNDTTMYGTGNYMMGVAYNVCQETENYIYFTSTYRPGSPKLTYDKSKGYFI